MFPLEREERVKKLIISLLVVGACRTTTVQSTTTTTTPPASPGATGAADAALAVRGFMAAVKQTDLQALGAFWGNKEGPAREILPRDELEKRGSFDEMEFLKFFDGDEETIGRHFITVRI